MVEYAEIFQKWPFLQLFENGVYSLNLPKNENHAVVMTQHLEKNKVSEAFIEFKKSMWPS